MTQTIDPVKLKAAAEHLEWALQQYPDKQEIRGLFEALSPWIEKAISGDIREPVDSMRIPGAYNFSDGTYMPYRSPDVGAAYAEFLTEMDGGLSQADKEITERIEASKAKLNR